MRPTQWTSGDVHQTIEQIQRLYRAVDDLREHVGSVNPHKYAVLAEGPIDQIRRLLAELDAHALAAGSAAPTLWMRIEGRDVQWPAAPTSVLSALLDILRKGVQALAELSVRGTLATRPTAVLKQACDLRVVAFVPGSLGIGLRPPEHVEMADVATRALDVYMTAASWAASDESEELLAQQLPDTAQRRLALREIARLVPRQRGDVELVELTTARGAAARAATLVRATRVRITRTLAQLAEEYVSTYSGHLREIDLDRRSFILRDTQDVTEIPCEFPEELLEAAKEALDKRVQVTGTKDVQAAARRGAPRLVVSQLEILDEDSVTP